MYSTSQAHDEPSPVVDPTPVAGSVVTTIPGRILTVTVETYASTAAAMSLDNCEITAFESAPSADPSCLDLSKALEIALCNAAVSPAIIGINHSPKILFDLILGICASLASIAAFSAFAAALSCGDGAP